MATVKMTKDDGATADVHPDMVEEYKKGGFVEDKQKKAPAKRSAKTNG